MATTFNTTFTNTTVIPSTKPSNEEQKSNLYDITTLTVSVPSSFLQKQGFLSDNEHSLSPIVKHEEVKSLIQDTQMLEQEVTLLEVRTIYKKFKIEDLRCLVERISDEDHYFDRTVDHKRYFNFVKCSNNYSSQKIKKQGYETEKRQSCEESICCRTVSAESTETTDTTCTAEEGEGGKPGRAIQGCGLHGSFSGSIDHCLLYWQSAFPMSMPQKKPINI